jgi:hypothetical protein
MKTIGKDEGGKKTKQTKPIVASQQRIITTPGEEMFVHLTMREQAHRRAHRSSKTFRNLEEGFYKEKN